ncbi:MAG: lipopolysaccharide heptosyltransferase family protein [Pedobacter sp.]|nr:MAG: lipopolysaccharide heptosyltransferase family protein [Pedobacter sp.]
MDAKRKILVIRFSAMGDVAMLASVLKELCDKYPDIELVMVSRKAFQAFFEQTPQVRFHSIEPKTKHKGFWGLWKLFLELKAYQVDAVADVHDNIRSRVLSFFFRLIGTPISRIDKGRAEKKALTRFPNKVLIPLKLTVERYADVFRELGFSFNLTHKLQTHRLPLPVGIQTQFNPLGEVFNQSDNIPKRIGVAPFAQHPSKVYSLHKMEQVISSLAQLGYQVYIFGGGATEKRFADNLATQYNHVYSVIGAYNLSQELAIISNLDLMLSMDSSGMHMASLVGVPVISIWGATHPFAGFLGYGQSLSDCIQYDHPKRPNSIYGQKPLLLNDLPIIDYIEPERVVETIKQRLCQNS